MVPRIITLTILNLCKKVTESFTLISFTQHLYILSCFTDVIAQSYQIIRVASPTKFTVPPQDSAMYGKRLLI